MKIRQGFVSNSSSSSFCILGYNTSLKELAKVFDVKLGDRHDYDSVDMVIDCAEKEGFVCIINAEDYDDAYIGFDIGGKTISEILELGIQPDDNDKISLLKIKMKKNYEPTTCYGELPE